MRYRPLPVASLVLSSVQAQFWNRVQRASGCWSWEGIRNEKGYGIFQVRRLNYLAHRVAYYLEHGECPGQFLVRHTCDHPWCVNPDHLLTGTNADNARDMVLRGRWGTYRHRGNGKLREEDVVRIKCRMLNGDRDVDIRRDYPSVTQPAINSIRHGKSWSWVLPDVLLPHPTTKLTDVDVWCIKSRMARGDRDADIHRVYSFVSYATIRNIRLGRSWKHVVL